MPPVTLIGRVAAASAHHGLAHELVHRRLLVEHEQRSEAVGGQLGEPVLALADDHPRQRGLLGDHRLDPLLDGAGAEELAHLDGAPLPDAERPVGGLVLHGRVPPAVQVHHVVGRREREPGAARLEREQHDRRALARLEPRHHLVAPLLRGAPVQERDVGVEPGRQVRHQQMAELGELGEAQHPVALGQDLGEDLLEAHDLARAAPDRGAVVQELGRVVADLLELGHRGEHVAPALDALRVLDLLHHVVDDRAVERGLLGREPVVLRDLDLLGQVVDDRRVGLDPAQQVGPGDRAQPRRRLVAAVPLDRHRVALAEAVGRAQQPGVEHVHHRPELRQAVLHRGAGERDPVLGVRSGAPPAPRDARLFLTAWASSSTSRRHAIAASSSTSRVAVA